MKTIESIGEQLKYEDNGFSCRRAEEIIQIRFVGTEIVRCKDCKHRSYWHTDTDDTPKWERCELFDHPTKGEDFCSRGERKDEK